MTVSQTPVPPHCHAISFFQDDGQLCAEIAAFIAEGLSHGEPGLIVTSPVHREGIARELAARGVDVPAAVGAGNLAMADAADTIAALMPNGYIDANIYYARVGAACDQLLRGRPGPVRIFGDMVDLLWQRGDYDAAIQIELLSNQLAVIQPISVICGYSMGHFLKTAARLEAVRHLHGHEHVPQAKIA